MVWKNSKKLQYSQTERHGIKFQIEGSITLLALILGVFLVFLGLSSLHILRKMHQNIHLQWRMDLCVGEQALFQKSSLSKIENENKRIIKIRKMIQTAQMVPSLTGVVQGLKAALASLVIKQEIEVKKWMYHQMKFIMSQGCVGVQGRAMALPATLPLQRDPPDLIGAKELRWIEKRSDFQILTNLKVKNRTSSARVSVPRKNQGQGPFVAEWEK